MADSFIVHIEPDTEAKLQLVHQLYVGRFGKNINFDRLIFKALGAYASVCKAQIKRKRHDN